MEALILWVIEHLRSWSYVGVVLMLSLEMVPAELVLPLVGYWVYEGDMLFFLAVLAGSVGGVTGPLTLYAVGRFGGRPLVEKVGKYFLIREKEIHAAERFFAKYGAGVAFFARFLPLVRTAISIPCGMAKMNVLAFSLYTFLAMVPITYLYVYIGFALGPRWREAAGYANEFLLPLVMIILSGLFFYIVVKWIIRRKC
ncbi:DedA family protein [Shouchella shacheensis]|uniref:DedA family protein n=1 Tax=Shouchella shacheensis TaxID=1649580 RepID=UPI0007400932|nr:DedA family protein [Shouchella shacheensis]